MIDDKIILKREDIKLLKPNFDALKLLSEELSTKIELILFSIQSNTVYGITTGVHFEFIKNIENNLNKKGYKLKLYYVDKELFNECLLWYNTLREFEETKKREIQIFREAKDINALDLLKKLYEERNKYNEGEFLEKLIQLSFKAGSSDLHFQSEKEGVIVRIRKDGILREIFRFKHDEFKKYLLKLKFLSKVKTNIDYLPQDGRLDIIVPLGEKEKKIDIRVSFMPGLRGENIVMRFLDSTKGIMSFTEIGFLDETYEILLRNIKKSYGIILVTGPTGSGKTTTLYSILNYLNDSTKKIITLEDPVEYELDGIQQSQIDEKKGYTYEEGLKSILRQDPDIIMVGEIRTKETAEIAINAALTGHLVLSTLHTNTAIEAISRFLNMGIQPYLLAPALNLIIGQRLVRRLHSCYVFKDVSFAEDQEIKDFIKKYKDLKGKNLEYNGKLYYPGGCDECFNDGYLGRIAIIETFELDDDLKNLIMSGKSTIDIYSYARSNGYLTMKEDGYLKVLKGLTTLDELRRVIG